MIVRSSM
jgi:TonB family protein